MKNTRIAFVFLLSSISTIPATDDMRRAVFFDSVQTLYLREYQACTGDQSFISAKELIQWKEDNNALAMSKEYLDLLKEYCKVDSSTAVLPCKVLAWNQKRKALQVVHEDSLSRELLAREELEAAAKEAVSCVKTPFDVLGLPFGLSKKSFLLLYKNSARLQGVPFFIDEGNYIYVKEMPWGGRTFLTAFYFDKSGTYFKYEIESPPATADRVNSTVRPDAEYLAHELAVRFGEPSRRYSIGFFDIKSGVLCPYKTWDADGYDVYVGISMSRYRYYAKAVISGKNLKKTIAADSSGRK
jgi:hypothetical protein